MSIVGEKNAEKVAIILIQSIVSTAATITALVRIL
jgi:hypothetical protein